MPESFDLSHQETQTSLPAPLDEVGFLDKIGTRALPASSLSVASALAFLLTFLFLQRNEKIRGLFVLPAELGFPLAILSAALAWTIVMLCRQRPGRPWARVWAFILAVLTSVSMLLLFAFRLEPAVNALVVAGFAAVLTLLPRLYKLRPDSGMLSRVAPLAFLGVLLPVLLAVGWMGHSIAVSKEAGVNRMIEQLSRWDADVKSVTGRSDWYSSWDDSARAVDKLGQVKLDRQPYLSLWREASVLHKDRELAAKAGGLLDTAVAGLAEDRVPRVSRLNEPATYCRAGSKHWEKGSVFPQASTCVGRYFQELGRIVSELDVQDSFPESQGLMDLRKQFLVERTKLAEELRPQMEKDWTDHWAVFRVPGHDDLLGHSDMPLSKLLKIASPIGGKAAADLPGFFGLNYGTAYRLGNLPGCRRDPFSEKSHEFFRIDCYSYSPGAKDLGADPRVEMRLVYESAANSDLKNTDLPEEVYFIFPVPEGVDKGEFRKQVMSDLAASVHEVTGLDVVSPDRSNAFENGFRIQDAEGKIKVFPWFDPWLDNREGLNVRAKRIK